MSAHEEHSHEHHHDHVHQHGNEFPLLEITAHESAVIGTVKCRIPGSYEEGQKKLQEILQRTAEDIENAGGLIGHLKAFAREEIRSCMISVTEADDLQIKQGRENALCVENANIVFGITENSLKDILKKNFSDYL
jgi:hypothetical protein